MLNREQILAAARAKKAEIDAKSERLSLLERFLRSRIGAPAAAIVSTPAIRYALA